MRADKSNTGKISSMTFKLSCQQPDFQLRGHPIINTVQDVTYLLFSYVNLDSFVPLPVISYGNCLGTSVVVVVQGSPNDLQGPSAPEMHQTSRHRCFCYASHRAERRNDEICESQTMRRCVLA